MKLRIALLSIIYILNGALAFAHDGGGPAQELHFRENKNQWDERINFIGFLNGGCIYLENNTITFKLLDGNDLRKLHPRKEPVVTLHGHIYKMHFEGANPNPVIVKESPSPEYYNYFIGNDPLKWASEVKAFQAISYLNLYPNIDFKVYGSGLTMKYDFIVHPGGNVNDIKISYEGTDAMDVSNSTLHIKTSVGEIIEAPPFSYQKINWDIVPVKCRYELQNNVLQFKLQENFNIEKDLIIDPTLIFSTYTGSTADNFGYTATYDDAGNLYMGGYVNTVQFGGAYPTTAGAFQLTFGGGTSTSGIQFPCDMGISKFNSTGSLLIYSTYLGGNDNETPHSLFVNTNNQLCVYGRTYSPNFPVTAGAYDPTYNGDADMSVSVFNLGGTALIGSTYIGGSGPDGVNFDPTEFLLGNLKYNYGDDARGEIICDASNNIYVSSCTSSSDFPASAGAFQTAWGGSQDGCVFKLNPNCTALSYSTYLGGNQDDACYSIDIKNDNSVFVCGGTQSVNFPTTAGVLNPAYLGGLFDGFLCHLNATGTTMLASTFLGTANADQSYNVKLDELEDVFVVGLSEGGGFPVSAGVYSNPNSGQFIAKLAPDLSSITFSTVFGNGNGASNISPTAFLVDTCGNIYVCGWGTNSATFGHTTDMTNMPLTADAFQSTTDGTDFYIIALSSNAQQLLYGTYFGGNGGIEHVDGGTSRFDKRGIIYEAICAGCGGNDLTPTTAGVWSTTNNSPNCNELGFKMEINLFEVTAQAIADPAATGCAPLTVNFVNNSVNATVYFWDFGDASLPSSLFQPTHTYTIPGTYIVMLIADNPTSCFGPDTAYTSVVVLNTNVTANFNMNVQDFCDSVVVAFSGSSTGSSTQFNWTFGDGTTGVGQNPTHVYFNDSTTVATFTITLIIYDSTACNPLDTVSQTITVYPKVEAGIGNPDFTGCAPLDCNFFYVGQSQTSVVWDFGDGSGTSSLQDPTHTYTAPGTYTVTVIGFNPVACNLADTAISTVTVFPPSPIPSFSASPTTVMLFEPIVFTNTTIGGLEYYWIFGDLEHSTDYSPTHIYQHGGDYTVCLLVNTSTPCPDSVCKKVTVLLPQAIGVPNAFHPCDPGTTCNNGFFNVEGQGIISFKLKVFNRWGEKVFETTDRTIGWDGVYKGKPQDMDVYVWELDALMEDGNSVITSGNVTLLR